MLYKVLIPAPVLMIPILVMTTKGTHSPKNDINLPSDVIVTYSNHAEANRDDKQVVVPETTTTATTVKPAPAQFNAYKSAESVKKSRIKPLDEKSRKESTEGEEPLQEDVLFIPNVKDSDIVRNEYYLQNDRASLGDLMGGHKTVEDLLAAKDVRLETESPVSDIIFVMGKNNDNIEHANKDREEKRLQGDRNKEAKVTPATPKLNCTNLNCNNTVMSVCGLKLDDNYQQKFRLFMNDCFFRKVNCHFNNPANRYKKVILEKCKKIGAHSQAPVSFSFKPAPKIEKPVQLNNTRRSTSSRRSMTMNIHGQFCSHPCPATCPEHYEPECAVSSSGQHRVFVNHCTLDHNSCSFGIVWHSVPLSQCVGGKKADLRQNAAFIGWMQRVGILDNKGRLANDAQI